MALTRDTTQSELLQGIRDSALEDFYRARRAGSAGNAEQTLARPDGWKVR